MSFDSLRLTVRIHGGFGKFGPRNNLSSYYNSPNYPSRFTDGNFGIFYAGNSEEVAFAESIHHYSKLMSASSAIPGWGMDFQLLEGSVSGNLHEVDEVPGALEPNDYRLSQHVGKNLRNAGSDGLTWTSVRRAGGRCIGVFWPDVVYIPIPSARYRYHWDGTRMDLLENLETGQIMGWS